MIPVLVIISIYFLFMKLDCFGKKTYEKILDKKFSDVLFDGMVSTWYGDTSWLTPTWTLSIELWATYLVYHLAQTARAYRGRFFIYLFVMLGFVTVTLLKFTNRVKGPELSKMV